MRKRQLPDVGFENDGNTSQRRSRIKLSSVIGKVNNDTINSNHSKPSGQEQQQLVNNNNNIHGNESVGSTAIISNSVKISSKIDIPPKVLQERSDYVERNRRMFAGIMGHLGRAKERLALDSSSIEKQAHIKSEALLKRQEDARRNAELKKKLLESEKQKVTQRYVS